MPRARLWCAAALSGSLAALILPIASGAENWDAWSSRRQDRLLIYTVGKTGSETLQQSLEAFTGQPVPYFHGEKGEILNRIGARKQVGVKCHKFEAAREFRDAAKKSRLWTVALVRNPFDREASAFFQNFDRHASGPCGTTKHDFDSIKAVFDKCRLGLSEDDAAFYPKFRKLTHVTLLDHASTVRENRTLRLYGVSGPVLLLRLEDMKSWATSLQPFFHNASFGHRNSADNADLYETFKRRYRAVDAGGFDSGGWPYVMHFDGGSRGNPGSAGCGAVVEAVDAASGERAVVWAGWAYCGEFETNNVAEYAGLMLGASAMAQRNITKCLICGDSKYVAVPSWCSSKWRCRNVNLAALRGRVVAVLDTFGDFELRHVPRAENAKASVARLRRAPWSRAAAAASLTRGSRRPTRLRTSPWTRAPLAPWAATS
ncbi:hypothetical protein M885DRAFT_584324, partial [Pelagophyceae sp. CCMP2097]